jgi:RTX calcium-binding nonapeptide repeat (4 copies)
MRRAVVVVLALVFVLALGVVFSARNAGIAQGVKAACQKANGSIKSLPQPPYYKPGTTEPLPTKDGMRPPKEIRNLPVCDIDGTNTLTGTDNVNMVDKIEGEGGGDTLTGGRGWNGLIGGPGKDTIKGGPGKDFVFAIDEVKQKTTGENAQVELRGNPEVDTVSCGAGNDTVYADKDTDGTLIDNVASDCEKVKNAEPDIPVAHWWRRDKSNKR